MDDRYERRNRRKYRLQAHIVLVTKYRKKLLEGDMGEFCKGACRRLADLNGWEIVAVETDSDHIHLLLAYDATERICDIVAAIKQRTTRWLWERWADTLSGQYWKKHIFWSDGYFACSVGEVSGATIERYIAEQG